MTAFLLSFAEVVLEVGKTPGATRVWLHRHGIQASGGLARVGLPRGAPRAAYDGGDVLSHKASAARECPACRRVSARAHHVTSSASGPTVSAARQATTPEG